MGNILWLNSSTASRQPVGEIMNSNQWRQVAVTFTFTHKVSPSTVGYELCNVLLPNNWLSISKALDYLPSMNAKNLKCDDVLPLRQSVFCCPFVRPILLNTISQKRLERSSLYLAQESNRLLRWTELNLVVKGHCDLTKHILSTLNMVIMTTVNTAV